MNLAVNSRDAMPDGGRLTIETANVELGEEYAALHPGTAAGNYVMLALSDTGCGMDAATRARIFEPFFTTKEKGKGTGLGLSIVYGIVKQNGGEVRVYSEPGHGATFKIYLPAIEGAAEEARVEVSRRTASATGTILLVEDEDQVRKLAHTILKKQGYEVLVAAGGAEAEKLLQEHPGGIDLLLTDVVMPGMGGVELAARIMAARPGIKVLYMSGYTDSGIVQQGFLREDTPYIQKPFTSAGLGRKVREVLEAG